MNNKVFNANMNTNRNYDRNSASTAEPRIRQSRQHPASVWSDFQLVAVFVLCDYGYFERLGSLYQSPIYILSVI